MCPRKLTDDAGSLGVLQVCQGSMPPTAARPATASASIPNLGLTVSDPTSEREREAGHGGRLV